MKRYVYGAGAVILTGMLVMLAMAVAQRDARVGDTPTDDSTLPYANQSAQPISIAEQTLSDGLAESSTGSWPPAPPIVRANDIGNEGNAYGNSPPLLPAAQTSLTSYSSVGESSDPNASAVSGIPNNSATSLPSRATSSPMLAEPPPLRDVNAFSQTLPGMPSTLPPSLPTTSRLSDGPPTLPPTNETYQTPGSALPLAPAPLPTAVGSPPRSLPPEPASSPFATTPSYPSQLPPSQAPTAQAPLSQGAATSRRIPSDLTSSDNGPPPVTHRVNQDSQPRATLGNPTMPSPTYPTSPSAASTPIASNNFSPQNNASQRQATFFSSAPGGRQLDGSQNPSMEIQKRAPSEVQVGVPATFSVLVRNVGNATAYDVHVVDAVPKGAKLVRTSPPAQVSNDNGLAWKLGEMVAGAEQILTIELIPETEGEIGSVASVNFAAQASVRTMSTQPKLVVKQIFEPLVLAGDSIRILIEVANVGTGTARNVRLQEDVPANLRHETGSQMLQRELRDMSPGEVHKLDIELTAISAGKVANSMRVVADNATTSESSSPLEVVAPKLEIALEGASLRYLERQVTYRIGIINVGSAIATNVEVVLYLPSGLQFNSTINKGSYLPNQHAVRWELEELAAGGKATTEVTLLPVEEGNFLLRLQSSADSVRAQPIEKPVRVEGQSELAFTIEDDNDPIETDGRTTYIVKIANIGTRVDNHVELSLDLPDGAVVEQVHAPVEYKVTQRNVIFAPIAQLQAKDTQTVRVSVRHTREGIHVVRAQLKSKLRPTSVSKEESTEVYRDR